MSAPAVVQGSLVDAKNVGVHKCIRLYVDVPAEMGEAIVKAFGWPSVASPVAVAVARLGTSKASPAPSVPAPEPSNDRTGTFAALKASQQAGILCQDPKFHRYLDETFPSWQRDLNTPSDFVRWHCGVSSRSELCDNNLAAQKWQELHADYREWLKPSFVG